MMKLIVEQGWKGYKLFKNDAKAHIFHAKWEGGWFKKNICHIKDEKEQLFATIEIGVSAWFWSSKESTWILNLIPSNELVEIRIISTKKGFWKFEYQGQSYEFHRHKGHKKALYKSDEQIAKFNKRKVNIGNSDKVTIISNSNENPVLLLGLFIIYDFHDDRDAEITIDFGNFTNGLKDFDEYWKPKI